MDKEGKRSCSLLQAEQHMLDFMEGRPLFIHSNHALVVTYNAQLLASLVLTLPTIRALKESREHDTQIGPMWLEIRADPIPPPPARRVRHTR
jgi:hypothetical protein